jgi:2-iminobutanoate/2-iminopropanoate deaminase
MAKEIIKTDKAPAAIGPYSQAVRSAGLVFTSGQIPLDPATGQIAGKDVASQTEQALKNLRAILESAGLSMDDVLKVTVYITDMSQFGALNEVYGRFFKTNPPARSAVEVSKLPKGALVEIEAVARVRE